MAEEREPMMVDIYELAMRLKSHGENVMRGHGDSDFEKGYKMAYKHILELLDLIYREKKYLNEHTSFIGKAGELFNDG